MHGSHGTGPERADAAGRSWSFQVTSAEAGSALGRTGLFQQSSVFAMTRAKAAVAETSRSPALGAYRTQRTGAKLRQADRSSNQSKAALPRVAYMPMTRPVKPPATSVVR